MGSLVASPRVVKGLYGTRRGAGPYGLTHRRLGGEGLLWVPPDGGTLWRALGPPSATKASYGAGPGGPSPWGRRPRGGPFCTDSRLRSLFRWRSHRFSLWRISRGSDLMGAWRSGDCRQYGEVISPRTGVGAEAPPNLLPPASHVRQVISPRGRRTPAGRRRARASPREGARRRREKAPGGSTTDPTKWKGPSTPPPVAAPGRTPSRLRVLPREASAGGGGPLSFHRPLEGKGSWRAGESNFTPDGRAKCFKFNKGKCDGSCGYVHACLVCNGSHPISECPRRPKSAPPATGA